MQNRNFVALCILVFIIFNLSGLSKRGDLEKDDFDLAINQTNFGIELLQRINSVSPKETIIISPVSISQVMALVMMGAKANTHTEIAELLHLPDIKSELIYESYSSQYDELIKTSKAIVNIANSIWYEQNFSIKNAYLKKAEEYFNARISSLDFNSPKAIIEINTWVSEQTNGLIKQIITPPLDPLKVFIALNAIYFKGTWQNEFNPKRTRIDVFQLLDGSEKRCNMMSKEDDFFYYEDESIQALNLIYNGDDLSMTIILPKAEIIINELISEFSYDYLEKISSEFKITDGYLLMPRYKLEYELILNDAFKDMGLEAPFLIDKADFSKMTAEKLYIDEIKHKTFIEVNEEGTEAAAVTSVGLKTVSIPKPGFIMKVNRPFLFLIRKKGNLLFLGKVVEPKE